MTMSSDTLPFTFLLEALFFASVFGGFLLDLASIKGVLKILSIKSVANFATVS